MKLVLVIIAANFQKTANFIDTVVLFLMLLRIYSIILDNKDLRIEIVDNRKYIW